MRTVYKGQIYVKEINDKKGDLVDLEFRDEECYHKGLDGSYAYWFQDYREAIPSDFLTDYDTCCKGCDQLLIAYETRIQDYEYCYTEWLTDEDIGPIDLQISTLEEAMEAAQKKANETKRQIRVHSSIAIGNDECVFDREPVEGWTDIIIEPEEN